MKFVYIALVGISVIAALVPHIVYIVAKVVSLLGHFRVSYRPYGYTALGLVIAWLLVFSWGHWIGRFFFETKTVDVEVKGLPQSFEGYRIVHISDFHLDGWAGHEDKFAEIVDSINAQNPDLIVCTGDVVSISTDEINPFIPILKRLKAKDGIISIMGNHDYQPYNRAIPERLRSANVARLQNIEREQLGWKLLLNEHTLIHRDSDSIAILGCENQSLGVHKVIQRGDLHKAMQGTEGICSILLTHDPTHWRGEVIPKTDIPLTLSGHTHSGQFRVFGASVAAFVYDEYDGLYTEGDQHLYVNIGLGGTMPMRVGATPEITVLNLHTHP